MFHRARIPLTTDVRTVSPDRGVFLGTVERNRRLCAEHFELTLTLRRFPEAVPGQFVQVLCRDASSACGDTDVPMLRRPFSIGGLRRGGASVEIDFLGRVVGPGTRWLNERRPGDTVDLLGPLGHGFMPPQSGESALLVAGGIGLPPIRWLAERLAARGVSCDAIFGAQSADLIPLEIVQTPLPSGEMTPCAGEFARCGVLAAITTDDGSLGLRGRVTDAMKRYLDRSASSSLLRVYACGPEPMLRAIARLCSERALPCELAMERVMACGMGTCQSCVVPVLDAARAEGWRYALCCAEGPVFAGAAIRWE